MCYCPRGGPTAMPAGGGQKSQLVCPLGSFCQIMCQTHALHWTYTIALNLTVTLQGRGHYCLCFMGGKTEAQRGYMTWPGPQR